jgi:hypothetical protein
MGPAFVESRFSQRREKWAPGILLIEWEKSFRDSCASGMWKLCSSGMGRAGGGSGSATKPPIEVHGDFE